MKTIIRPNLERINAELDPRLDRFIVDDTALLTLSYLMGFDNSAGLGRILQADNSGRLFVNTGGLPSSLINILTPTIDTTVQHVLQANSNRQMFIIVNTGSVDLFMGKDSTLTLSNGFPIFPSTSFTMQGYIGDVYLINNTAGETVKILELVAD